MTIVFQKSSTTTTVLVYYVGRRDLRASRAYVVQHMHVPSHHHSNDPFFYYMEQGRLHECTLNDKGGYLRLP